MSKAIEDLKHEHDAILSALEILEKMISASRLDSLDAGSFIGFLKEFADKCHHGKEEGILFPALTRAGIPEEGGPIGVMLSEHIEGRKLIKEMEEAISRSADSARFSVAARQYQTLLRNHIEKENNVLFPMADNVLGAKELEEIYESFEQHEEKVIGQGRHEELHELLIGLKTKYSV